MSNKFYQELNLPGNPLLPDAFEKLCKEKLVRGQNKTKHYSLLYFDYTEYLNKPLLEVFKNLGIEPLYFIHFGSMYNTITTSILHTDLYNHKGKWQPVPFSINWDLSQGATDWHWYDTKDLPQVWPPYQDTKFSGIHYGKWDSTSTDGCTEIGKFSMKRKTPYLVRTDVPHQITYSCDEPVRMALSVRFDMDTIPSWDRALQVFEPLCL